LGAVGSVEGGGGGREDRKGQERKGKEKCYV
jgi:hypothetical protein